MNLIVQFSEACIKKQSYEEEKNTTNKQNQVQK
jgi:hypothetical protein